jgi:uncharacterized membrane protein YkgB
VRFENKNVYFYLGNVLCSLIPTINGGVVVVNLEVVGLAPLVSKRNFLSYTMVSNIKMA